MSFPTSGRHGKLSTNAAHYRKGRLVLTDESANYASIYKTHNLARNGLKVGAKIAIICSISKKKLKKEIISSKYLVMLWNMIIFAPPFR